MSKLFNPLNLNGNYISQIRIGFGFKILTVVLFVPVFRYLVVYLFLDCFVVGYISCSVSFLGSC